MACDVSPVAMFCCKSVLNIIIIILLVLLIILIIIIINQIINLIINLIIIIMIVIVARAVSSCATKDSLCFSNHRLIQPAIPS